MLSMGAGTPSNRQRRQAYGGYGASGQAAPHAGGPANPIGQAPNFPAGGGPSGFTNNANCRKFVVLSGLGLHVVT
jgi:hypothetical protein